MGYASISGHARTDATSPRAFAVCDRCARWWNHDNLRFQYDYRGRSLQNIRILVCDECYDTPQPQLLPRIIPPDPIPIQNARTEFFAEYETNTRTTQGMEVDFFTGLPITSQGNARITQDYNTRVTQQTGQAPGGKNLFPGVRYTVPGDGIDNVPYGSPGVPYTGLIVEEQTYCAWTSSLTNPMYFVNNDGFEIYMQSSIFTPVFPSNNDLLLEGDSGFIYLESSHDKLLLETPSTG